MKTLKEKIAVMQAFEDGAEIEFTAIDNDNWISSLHPLWNWRLCDYRVANPKPRECWVNYYELNSDCAHSTKVDANKSAIHNRTECVHFREVLEDG